MKAFFPFLLAAMACTSPPALALVNPALQPSHLADRNKGIVALEVTGFDEESATYSFTVKKVLAGEFVPKTVTLAIPKTSDNGSGEEEDAALVLRDGSPVVAFVSKTGRRGADEALLYVGNREWHEAKFTDANAPDAWTWTAKSAEAMSGTFNGDPVRLTEMMADYADGTYFFPAQAHTRFGQDIVLATFEGPLSGVGIHDFNSDGKPDVIAGTPDGIRVFLQKDRTTYEEASASLGLEGVKASNISIADVNADGKADLLLDDVLFIARDGKFERSDRLATQDGALQASGLADVNGDGYPDVLVSRKEGGLHLFLNPGTAGGNFTDASEAAGLREDQANPKGTGFFAAGDWNDDSRTDLFFGAGRALLLVQDENGHFAPAPGRVNIDLRDNTDFAEGLTGAAVFGAVWTTDHLDLAIPTDSRVSLLIRDGDKATEVTGQGNEIGVTPAGLWGSIAEDLSANGEVDVFSVTRLTESSSNVFHLNRGYGSFMYPERYEVVFPGKSYTIGAGGAAAGDMDGDGANDLVLGGLDGRLVLSPNETLALRTPKEHPKQEEAKLLATRILTVTPKAKVGLRGAKLWMENAAGETVAMRVLGAGSPAGSQGPDVVNFAIREPGDYTLHIRYSDGETKSQSVKIGSDKRQMIELVRE